MESHDVCRSAQKVIQIEIDAIAALKNKIDQNFTQACQLILQSRSHVIVMGMGKSGHIANKIAATLASTGTPAFFVHPGEAGHGDMGMITANNVILALSNSGETPEIVVLLPLIKRLGVGMISMTGQTNSTLATAADVHLDSSVAREACPLGLAPTASSTAALVLGDALAIALLEARGFTADDYAFSHPSGQLGKKLLLKVADIMRTGIHLPIVNHDISIKDALMEMSKKGMGMTIIVDQNQQLTGIFTDGDLRRTLDTGHDIYHTQIHTVMTAQFKTTTPDTLAVNALALMENHKITALAVVNNVGKLVGAIHLHDLLSAGV